MMEYGHMEERQHLQGAIATALQRGRAGDCTRATSRRSDRVLKMNTCSAVSPSGVCTG